MDIPLQNWKTGEPIKALLRWPGIGMKPELVGVHPSKATILEHFQQPVQVLTLSKPRPGVLQAPGYVIADDPCAAPDSFIAALNSLGPTVGVCPNYDTWTLQAFWDHFA